MTSEIKQWKSGELVQLRQGVIGAGDVGMVIGQTDSDHGGGCLDVLYHDGIRMTHPSNLTRARRGGKR
jgi:hypothetical protein